MLRMRRCAIYLVATAFAGTLAGAACAGPSDASGTAGTDSRIERDVENRVEGTRQRQHVDQQLWLLRQERLRARNRPSPAPLDVPVFEPTPRQ